MSKKLKVHVEVMMKILQVAMFPCILTIILVLFLGFFRSNGLTQSTGLGHQAWLFLPHVLMGILEHSRFDWDVCVNTSNFR